MKNNRKLLITILISYIAILIILLLMILPYALDVIKEELLYEIGVESLFSILIFIIVCITLLVSLLFYLYSKNEKMYADQISNISGDRRYLESEMNEINRKLVSTDERWNEVYHLLISSQMRQIDRTGQISSEKFLNEFGIDSSNIEIIEDFVFVLTSFHEDFQHTYAVVNKTCENMQLVCKRSDEQFLSKDILRHIIESIVTAKVVIANLDGRNPNVFYELGIAQALNKPTILLSNVADKVPFDVQNQSLVLYKNSEELEEKLKEVLLKIIDI